MRFFIRKGNYIKIDNSDLSNKIDIIKSEFIQKKHYKNQPKYSKKKILKNILKLSIWTLFFVLIILLIKSYFFKDKLNKEKKSIINTNKKDFINLNNIRNNQSIDNTTQMVIGNITYNKKKLNMIENKTIVEQNESISFNKEKLIMNENKTIIKQNESNFFNKKNRTKIDELY